MSLRTTHIYKVVGGCKIHADVYPGRGVGPHPVVVWLHGGALIFGNRRMLPASQLARYRDAGYAVVAVDYRLAPETKLPEIVADVRDAVAWVRGEGARRFGFDGERLAVVGHSSGGYLALMAGCVVRPRPRALVAFYGYGDIAGAWYSEPSPFYRRQPLVSEAEARSVVGSSPLADPPGDGAPADRRRFYLYCRQQGLWPQEVAGMDPAKDRAALSRFCPVEQVGSDYPPTLLLHGDDDSDVPYEQSVMMAGALAAAGIAHQFVTIAGGEHGFDARMDDPAVAAAFEEAVTFLARHV